MKDAIILSQIVNRTVIKLSYICGTVNHQPILEETPMKPTPLRVSVFCAVAGLAVMSFSSLAQAEIYDASCYLYPNTNNPNSAIVDVIYNPGGEFQGFGVEFDTTPMPVTWRDCVMHARQLCTLYQEIVDIPPPTGFRLRGGIGFVGHASLVNCRELFPISASIERTP